MSAPDLDLRGGLVLLHGFTGSPAAWDDVLAASPPALDRGRVLRPALLGHGAPPPEATDFDGEVDRLAALVDEDDGLERPHLAGYSLGARLALGLLVRHPRRFRGATLIGVHPGLETEHARDARRRSDAGWAERLERDGLEAFVAAWEALPLFESQATLAGTVRAAQREQRLRHDAGALARSLRVLGLGAMPPRWNALAALAMPVRLLVGGDDPTFLGLAARAARMLPRCTVQVVEGAGHNVVLERPTAFWTPPSRPNDR